MKVAIWVTQDDAREVVIDDGMDRAAIPREDLREVIAWLQHELDYPMAPSGPSLL
jgi:hypothetical protein